MFTLLQQNSNVHNNTAKRSKFSYSPYRTAPYRFSLKKGLTARRIVPFFSISNKIAKYFRFNSKPIKLTANNTAHKINRFF